MSTDAQAAVTEVVAYLREQLAAKNRFVPIGEVLRRISPAAEAATEESKS